MATVDEPDDFRGLLDGLPDEVEIRTGLDGSPHIVVLFVTERAALEEHVPKAAGVIPPDGAIWVAWPKKASRVPTDVTEDVVRQIALPLGLVDNKVCAISHIWSGPRAVWRREHRT